MSSANNPAASATGGTAATTARSGSRDLVYICPSLGSAFDSQVAALLLYYAEHRLFARISLVVGVRSEQELAKLQPLTDRISVHSYRAFPQYPLFDALTAASLRRVLNPLLGPDTVVHAREAFVAFLAGDWLRSRNARLLIDVRGAPFEFSIYLPRGGVGAQLKRVVAWQLGRALRKNVWNVSAVSTSLARHLSADFGIDSGRIAINPCIAAAHFAWSAAARERTRAALGIGADEFLLVFSTGGDAPWQETAQFLERSRSWNCRILILSNKDYSHYPHVISRYVSYSEVPDYLCAADAGVLLRSRNIVNQVASPIKFSEYSACGLPTLANDGVDFVVETLRAEPMGVLIDSIDDIDAATFARLRQLDRGRIAELGQRIFGIDVIAAQYIETYRSL